MNYRQLSVTIQRSTDGMVIAPVDRNIFHFFAEGQAMEVIYKSCHVVTVPELNPDADCWIPKADIFWDEYGMRHHQLLTGLSHYFKIIDEAEINALEIARAWIDAELTDDPIPHCDRSPTTPALEPGSPDVTCDLNWSEVFHVRRNR